MGSTANSTTIFNLVPYESNISTTGADTNLGFLIRIQPTVLTLTINDVANAAPDAGLILQTGLYAYATNKPRSKRLCARAITISRIVGTAPLQFRLYRRVPVLTVGTFISLRLDNPPTFSYQGQTDWTLVSVHKESADYLDDPPDPT
jgi:hypothetical protein